MKFQSETGVKLKAYLNSHLGSVLLILGVLAGGLMIGGVLDWYRKTIPVNVRDVSSIYLEEIAYKEIGHLESSLDSQFQTLQAAGILLRDCGCQDIPSLQKELAQFQHTYGFAFFALVDEDGNYCSPTEYESSEGKIDSLGRLLKGEERLLSYNETIAGSNVILLGKPIEAMPLGDSRFVAVVAGATPESFIQMMALSGKRSQSRTSIVQDNGTYVVGTSPNGSEKLGASLFSVLGRANMDKGFSTEKLKSDMLEGREGMLAFHMDGIHTFLYYAPVPNSSWYVLSQMPYETISATVGQFMNSTTLVGLFILCIIICLCGVFLYFAYRAQAEKRHAEAISATLRETGRAKQQAENALKRMAFYDELTGIANRNLFRESVKALLADSVGQYAYVIYDIRKFKVINDLFGYSQGDLLLKHIARILQEEASPKEAAARDSADVFHLLLVYTSKSSLEDRLLRIAARLCDFTFSTDSSYHISAGFGIYVVENPAEPVAQMGDKASLALKNIKEMHTTSMFFYNDDIRNRILAEQEIENDMQRGIENEEFVVFFQPKYSPNPVKLCGAEALVRWRHPSRGLISPIMFIPLFEKNNFITTLDLYMLEAVCQTIRRWLDEGREVVPVSVNQSRLLLYGTDYVAHLMAVLNKYQIPHDLVELEVTESVFFEDTRRMVSLMQELHDLHFMISMDDFGSGYSSLNMLKELMVDTLKIDKDFFSESAHTERGRVIVSNIISMARDLNIRVVAEGVETREEVDFLCDTGCDLVQGYFFFRPLCEEDYEKLIPIPEAVVEV